MPVKREIEFRAFLKGLAEKDWVHRTERRWWPYFAFHYTDIRNAARILEEGVLYSRLQAEKLRKLTVSSGSKVVLAGTSLDIKDYVRLYFRPKTPTQYHVEGVHSWQSLSTSSFPDAHCPVPVFFLFDAARILSRPDCRFSDRGLGGHGYRLGSTLDDLRQLPWKQIYHISWIDWSDPQAAHEIVACRNAEVIMPRQLDLDALRFIYCRSEAEKDTLVHLLQSTRQQYQSKIFASARNDPFFRRRTFIENVVLMPDGIRLRFSPDTRSSGPFRLRIERTTADRTTRQEKTGFQLGPVFDYHIRFQAASSSYQVNIMLDEHLVYANEYKQVDLPF